MDFFGVRVGDGVGRCAGRLGVADLAAAAVVADHVIRSGATPGADFRVLRGGSAHAIVGSATQVQIHSAARPERDRVQVRLDGSALHVGHDLDGDGQVLARQRREFHLGKHLDGPGGAFERIADGLFQALDEHDVRDQIRFDEQRLATGGAVGRVVAVFCLADRATHPLKAIRWCRC